MDPRHRTLRRVTIGDAEAAEQVFELLMGNDVAPRRDFIVDGRLPGRPGHDRRLTRSATPHRCSMPMIAPMLTWLASGSPRCRLRRVAVARWWLRRRRRPRPAARRSRSGLRSAPGWSSASGLPSRSCGRSALEAPAEHAASAWSGARSPWTARAAGQEFVDAGAELGYVRYGPDGVPERSDAHQARTRARTWRATCGSDRTPDRDQVVAVHVLSHEARHMAGLTDEARAECVAVQRDARTARLLGAIAGSRRAALARRYWRRSTRRMPDEYRTPDCAPGGAARRAPARTPRREERPRRRVNRALRHPDRTWLKVRARYRPMTDACCSSCATASTAGGTSPWCMLACGDQAVLRSGRPSPAWRRCAAAAGGRPNAARDVDAVGWPPKRHRLHDVRRRRLRGPGRLPLPTGSPA